MANRGFKAFRCAFFAAVVVLSTAAGCSEDDSNFRLTWVNTHGVAVEVRIEGEKVTWCGDSITDNTTLPAGTTRTSCNSYPAGHYEYMVFEAGSGNPVVCEGRFDVDSDHKTFETKPVPGGATYYSSSGDC